jgi:uracil-DNA glycosylase
MNKGQKRVTGTGSIEPLVFFIGESPGRLGADQTGIPFTKDRSGQLLRRMIEEIGLCADDVYISNVLKCNPRNEEGRNRRPSTQELTSCREFLLTELSIIRPKVIVPLGELAASEFLGRNVIMSEINGRAFSHRKYGNILPLFHPGYIIRGNYSISKYRQDFERLRRFVSF